MSIESHFNSATRAGSPRDKRHMEEPDCTPSNKKHKKHNITTRKVEIELSESTISALQQQDISKCAEYEALQAIKVATKPPPMATSSSKLKIVERTGDIFQDPSNQILIHACNCEGTWGAGIALAFKEAYPHAHRKYQSYCKSFTPTQTIGTALLVHPKEFYERPPKVQADGTGAGPFIACLFTSKRKGRGKDTPAEILSNTRKAMEDLIGQMKELGGNLPGSFAGVRMCRINSGLFNVPWKDTKAVLEDIEVGDLANKEIEVVTLAEEVEKKKTKGSGKK